MKLSAAEEHVVNDVLSEEHAITLLGHQVTAHSCEALENVLHCVPPADVTPCLKLRTGIAG